MALPSCRRCGETDPRRMIGLMTLWFGPYVELEPAHGYFHLCPACYGQHVAPNLDDIQSTLARLHPASTAFLELEQGDPEREPPPGASDGGDEGDRDAGGAPG